jgi:DNA (cytosine-5)-methyltransferase 1
MGLYRAGFDVTGVDVEPQPRYPFAFVCADALSCGLRLEEFDFIWASPPCQAYSSSGGYQREYLGTKYPDLIAPIRALLKRAGTMWCIENVPQAPIRPDVVLDGTMFAETKVIRVRHFELGGFWCMSPPSGRRPGLVLREGYCCVVGNGTPSWLFKRGVRSSAEQWRVAMGIDWMSKKELAQAIPPVYSEYIARAALADIRRGSAA